MTENNKIGIQDVVRRVRGEFLEMPGLRLTPEQADASGDWTSRLARRCWAPSLTRASLRERGMARSFGRIGAPQGRVDPARERDAHEPLGLSRSALEPPRATAGRLGNARPACRPHA